MSSLIDALLLDPVRVNVWICRRTDGIAGTGSISDPFCANTAEQFDAVMNSLDEFTRVHLGPGVFETKGYSDAAPTAGWTPKRGMKIVGSGIDVTTLRLIDPGVDDEQYFLVGHPLGAGSDPLDFFEINSLTLDANLQNQSMEVAYGAIRVKGNHSRIRGIKAINWGTQSAVKGCHVISAITGDPSAAVPQIFDTMIGECIVTQPGSTTQEGPITLLHAGRQNEETVGVEAVGESAVIRNCFVDGSPASGDPFAA